MPYRIAFLSKFPPIEGGIAAKTFWLARGLAKRGHEVHVITHGISAGGEYRIQGGEKIPQDIPNLRVHRPSDDIPWHIPEDNEQSLSLMELAINVVREYDIQIIDTGYLIPYGIIGNLVKLSTGAHHVMRHGGSDIEKFLKRGIWDNVLHDAIRQADMVITEKRYESLFRTLSQNITIQPAYVPDEGVFRPIASRTPQNRLAFIGKVNHYWQHKQLDKISNIMIQLSDQYECLLVGQGNGMKDFQDYLGTRIVSKLKWLPFISPWEMPRLLYQLDAIFIFELNLPHPIISNLVIEAICTSVGIITDRGDFADTYRGIVKIDKAQIIILSSSDSASNAADLISQWVQYPVKDQYSSCPIRSYQEYLEANESAYSDILRI